MNNIEPKLLNTLLSILGQHPDGLSEVQLFRALSKAGYTQFAAQRPESSLQLFKRHFLLFHLLYLCQNHCYLEQMGNLSIHTLCICLHPYRPGQPELDTHDALKAYYLDYSQLDATTKDDVDSLLNSFWNQCVSTDEAADALATLEMRQADSYQQVKQQYRRLAMRYHPDRGGSTDKLQQLNQAKETLRRHFA